MAVVTKKIPVVVAVCRDSYDISDEFAPGEENDYVTFRAHMLPSTVYEFSHDGERGDVVHLKSKEFDVMVPEESFRKHFFRFGSDEKGEKFSRIGEPLYDERLDSDSRFGTALVICKERYDFEDSYIARDGSEMEVRFSMLPGSVYEYAYDYDDENVIHIRTAEIDVQIMRKAFERHFAKFETFGLTDRI